LPLAQSCGSVSSAPPAPAAPRVLANASTSAEDLARRFLDALGRDDLEAIKALRLEKSEFCSYVWPELPASKLPNVTCDFAWSQATLNSMAGMNSMLKKHKRHRYELVSLRFAAPEERHESFVVLKDPLVTVRDETGETNELCLFGSMLQMDGQYKLFSFVVDY
jgi:hypothetical protein